MLKLNSITFKDDVTGKIVDVNIDGHVTSNQTFSVDEFTLCSFHAGLIFTGGLKEVKRVAEGAVHK